MKEQLISLNTAKLAKEKGFDIPCINVYKDVELYKHKAKRYNGSFNKIWKEEGIKNSVMSNAKTPRYTAPTQSLLQKWLREKYKIDVSLHLNQFGYGYMYSINSIKDCKNLVETTTLYTNGATRVVSYEEALEEGLQEALKLIK